MSSKYGVNIELYNKAPKNISTNTSRPIAIIGDDTKLRGLSVYANLEAAISAVGEGSIADCLQDFKAAGFSAQIILSAFSSARDDSLTDDENTSSVLKKCLKAIDDLQKCEQEVMAKPKFILAPTYNLAGVQEALKVAAKALRAVRAIELNASDEAGVTKQVQTTSTDRAIVTFQKVQRTDGVVRPASAFLIAKYAQIMNEGEFGFAQTYSNRVIDGVTAIIDTIEYIQGQECQADRLRDLGVSCIFVDSGIRAWGREGGDKELGFKSLHSVVIFDTIIDTLFKAQKDTIDRGVSDKVLQLKEEMNAFCRKLVANGVLLGYSLSLPDDLNTNETIADGQIYIKLEAQEMPLISKLTTKIYRVNAYGSELIKEL